MCDATLLLLLWVLLLQQQQAAALLLLGLKQQVTVQMVQLQPAWPVQEQCGSSNTSIWILTTQLEEYDACKATRDNLWQLKTL